jgi:hypothetical protein
MTDRAGSSKTVTVHFLIGSDEFIQCGATSNRIGLLVKESVLHRHTSMTTDFSVGNPRRELRRFGIENECFAAGFNESRSTLVFPGTAPETCA